ncbi:MAG: hypothetical protein H6502_03270 [Candidatus Woesearchaeota archaeon]|nr:MAG: hypothetical protein H6502_03270 [Candidatus Woesearchaeota archaeon]
MGVRLLQTKFDIDLRPCEPAHIGFIYELMQQNLRAYFDATPERWSRQKFKEGFVPDRITLLEHLAMPIGYYDVEPLNGLYVHNIQLSHDYKGFDVGPAVVTHLKSVAQNTGQSSVWGKVFYHNKAALRFFKSQGFAVVKDLPEQKSVILSVEV